MRLSQTDVKILQLIEVKPTISVQEIADKVGVSWITANRHIEKLKTDGIISEPVAVFESRSLGLDRWVVLFEVQNEQQMVGLENACDIHPYTHYRSRVYGPYAGLFTQFDIPPEGEDSFLEFLDELTNIGLTVEPVKHRSTGNRVATNIDLEQFDLESMSWQYDWTSWSEAIERASSSLPIPPKRMRIGDYGLKEVDLKILRELTKKYTVSQNELQEKFSLSQSTVSRKVISINQNFIESVRAQIDRSIFDVTSTKLFYATDLDDAVMGKLFNALDAETAPPFSLSMDCLEGNNMLLWCRMPPSHEHNLYYALWKVLPNLKVFTMDTVRGHSCLYYFYHENYDHLSESWRDDEDWIFHSPITQIRQSLEKMNPNK